MKKIYLLVLVAVAAMTVQAETIKKDGLYYSLGNTTATLVSDQSSTKDLQSVTLPATLTTINTDAFYGCVKLGSINLEEGLTTINQRAFYSCNWKDLRSSTGKYCPVS